MKVFGSTKQSYLFQDLPRAKINWTLLTLRKLEGLQMSVESMLNVLLAYYAKKYIVLQGTLPIDFLSSNGNKCPVIDRIARVCSALTNLCPPIIPFD